MVGHPAGGASSSFQINSGAEGSGCANPQPLAPAFNAQSQNTQAGAFTRFTLNLTHRDQDQPLSAMSVQLPPGIAAMLASVTPCGEPQAAEGIVRPGKPDRPHHHELRVSGPNRSRSAGRSTSRARTTAPRSACRS